MLKNLKFVEPLDYTPDSNGFFALAFIDRKELTVEDRVSENPVVEEFNYDTFFRCREVFGKVFEEDSKSILFTHAQGLSENISSFLKIIETKLNIAAQNQSICFTTCYKNVLAIRVSKWWLECSYRRQIFTLFLRAGRKFSKDFSIEQIFHTNNDCISCYPAINLFLSGYHKFCQSCFDRLKESHQKGFVWFFSGKTAELIVQENLMTK